MGQMAKEEVMKILILLIFFGSFFHCTSLEKNPGSIAKQIDLVEDLVEKLPEEDKPRLKKFFNNVRAEEVKQDKTIENTKDDAMVSKRIALDSKEDAGKWQGIRNTFIAIISIFVITLIGYLIIKLGLVKVPLLN